MDAQTLSLIPTGTVASVLVVVIFYLLRQNHLDRKQYRDDVARIEARAARELLLQHEQHEASALLVKEELRLLRLQVKEALAELDTERHLRWKAEDVAARIRQQYGVPEGIEQNDHHTTEPSESAE